MKQQSAQELAPILLAPQMVFFGLFISITQIPVWLRWGQYLCTTKYAFSLAMLIEFDPSNAINEANRMEFENLLAINDVYASRKWVYALLIFVLFVGFRLIALIILNERAKTF